MENGKWKMENGKWKMKRRLGYCVMTRGYREQIGSFAYMSLRSSVVYIANSGWKRVVWWLAFQRWVGPLS